MGIRTTATCIKGETSTRHSDNTKAREARIARKTAVVMSPKAFLEGMVDLAPQPPAQLSRGYGGRPKGMPGGAPIGADSVPLGKLKQHMGQGKKAADSEEAQDRD